MRKNPFSIWDVLAVFGCIAVLLLCSAAVKYSGLEHAHRLSCAANLHLIGQACDIYTNAYDGAYPVAGGPGNNTWACRDQQDEYWGNYDYDWSGDDNMTISASQYLLVRIIGISPKAFVCPESHETALEYPCWGWHIPPEKCYDFDYFWDFGHRPKIHVSYSYHFPYEPYNTPKIARPLTITRDPNMAVMADKSPWYDDHLERSDSVPRDDEDPTQYVTLINLSRHPWDEIPMEELMTGNSGNHGRRGQNVLRIDGSVRFETRSDVGANHDNIYTFWTGPDSWQEEDVRRGWARTDPYNTWAKTQQDSMLVNDGFDWFYRCDD